MKKKFIVVAIVFYVFGAIMLYKGCDKMTRYYNSDNYYGLKENAYVGGDAYNYIINGTYSTSFFVLAAGCMITGTLFLGMGKIDLLISKNEIKVEVKNEMNNELPPL